MNIAAYFRQKVHFFSPQGIAFIMYEFARHELYPDLVVFRAVRRVRPHLSQINDRALVALAVALAKFDWPERRLLRRLSAEVREPRRFVRLKPKQVTVVLHSYARLVVRDEPLIKATCSLLQRASGQLDLRTCTVAAFSLGLLGVRGSVWSALAERIHSRVDRHPPLHLALIAHGFGKASAREENLLVGSLPDAAMNSISGFTPKHLACLLDGLTLAGCFHEDLFRLALEKYIRLGSSGGNKRQRMMSRVIFSLVLEQPSFIAAAPVSWQPMLEHVKEVHPNCQARPYHAELDRCARALSLRARARRRKGPYLVDLHVAAGNMALAVHLYPKEEACVLSGELLGAARLRQRHLNSMQWKYLGLGREEWLRLPNSEARIDALDALVSPHVATRRRRLDQVDASAMVLEESSRQLALDTGGGANAELNRQA